jgi:histidinol-phosphatase (PHP family)
MSDAASTLPPDYHTHNLLCKHARGVALDYARIAAIRRLPALAATDHCPTDDRFGDEHRMRLEQFPLYLEMVADARRASEVPVLLGVEADYYRGCEAFLKDWLQRHPFDVVLGSVHFLDYRGRGPIGRTLTDGLPSPELWRRYFALVAELARTGLYDVVAHLDLPKKFGHVLTDEDVERHALPALQALADAGMALEINTSGLVQAPGEIYPSPLLLRLAREFGLGLTFGSDAHDPERAGDGFEHALDQARVAGFTERVEFSGRQARRVAL